MKNKFFKRESFCVGKILSMQTSDLAICYGIYINICCMLMRIAMVGVLFLKRKRRNWTCKFNQNVTHCVSLFCLYYPPLEDVQCRPQKSPLFSVKLTYVTLKKTL